MFVHIIGNVIETEEGIDIFQRGGELNDILEKNSNDWGIVSIRNGPEGALILYHFDNIQNLDLPENVTPNRYMVSSKKIRLVSSEELTSLENLLGHAIDSELQSYYIAQDIEEES